MTTETKCQKYYINTLSEYVDKPNVEDNNLFSIMIKLIQNNPNNICLIFTEYIKLFIKSYFKKLDKIKLNSLFRSDTILVSDVKYFSDVNILVSYINSFLHKLEEESNMNTGLHRVKFTQINETNYNIVISKEIQEIINNMVKKLLN